MRKMSAAEITRKNLMDAYWLLYRKNGRGRITVKEIAETAGYNRSTFYEYFTSVEDVYRALQEQIVPLEPLHALQLRFLTEGMGFTELMKEFLPMLKDNLERFAVLMGVGGDLEFRERFLALWRPCFTARLRQEGLEPQQAEIYGEFILSGMVGMIAGAWDRSPDSPEEETLSHLAAHWPEIPGLITKSA